GRRGVLVRQADFGLLRGSPARTDTGLFADDRRYRRRGLVHGTKVVVAGPFGISDLYGKAPHAVSASDMERGCGGFFLGGCLVSVLSRFRSSYLRLRARNRRDTGDC